MFGGLSDEVISIGGTKRVEFLCRKRPLIDGEIENEEFDVISLQRCGDSNTIACVGFV